MDIPPLAALTMDERRLVLPQAEIRSFEPVLDIVARTQSSEDKLLYDFVFQNLVGFIDFEGERWSVYCLSGDFVVLPELLPQRRICVLLNGATQAFGLVCDQVEPLKPDLVKGYPMPPCMRRADSPIQGLILYAGMLGYLTTTDELARFLEHDSSVETP